jgi:phage protein U
MARIGSFGGVTFEVSTDKVLTFNGLSRGGSARWSLHEIHLKKPMPEFLGPGQETVSFKIRFTALHGVNPETELNKLRAFRDTGKVSSFILGTQPISSSYWYIDDISEDYKTIDGKGRIISVDATVTLKEYPKPIIPAVNPKPKPKPKAKAKPPASKRKPLGKITIKANMLNCRAAPSLKGKIVKVLRKNQTFTVYGTKKTDITWYDLGGGLYCSASPTYTTFKKG